MGWAGPFRKQPSSETKQSHVAITCLGLDSCGWLLAGQTLIMVGFMASYRRVGRM